MLVASLLSVVRDSQHAEATSLTHAPTPRSSAKDHLSGILKHSDAPDADIATLIKELFWPSEDSKKFPDRAIRGEFAAMAGMLSPSDASADIATFRELNAYRNRIHRNDLHTSDPPTRDAIRLWEKYSVLALRHMLGNA